MRNLWELAGRLPSRQAAASLLLALMAQSSFAAPATAQNYQTDYLAIQIGLVFPEKSFGTNGDGETYGVLYGRPLQGRFSLEFNLNGSVLETGTYGGTDFYQQSLITNLVYNLRDTRGLGWTPFVLAGLGIAHNDLFPNTRDSDDVVANVGVGIVSGPLFKNGMSLRMDALYLHDTVDSGHAEPRITLGIEVPLGGRARAASVVAQATPAAPAPVQYRDVIREVVREVPRPWIDSDGDGVDDDHDRCPATPAGLRADAQGCVIANQTIALTGVSFDFNKATLTANAQSVLDYVARAFINQPQLRVQIAGHTDAIGSAAANLKLSQQRADAVRAYLISKGAAPEQLTAVGYGKTQLLDSKNDEQAHERNRRVELRVLEATSRERP